MLDQGVDADIVSDVQKYLEDLINSGLRQRLISLIKVWTLTMFSFTSCLLKCVVMPFNASMFP